MITEFITAAELDELRHLQGLRILITGPRRSGKSKLGQNLAQTWGGAYISPNPQAQISALTETVAEELALSLETIAESSEELENWVLSLAENFGLENLLSQNPLKLSGGQTQMLLMAANSMLDVPLIVLDEPLAGLDYLSKTRLMQGMRDYPGNIVWISSRPNLAETDYATQILDLTPANKHYQQESWDIITSHAAENTLQARTTNLRAISISPYRTSRSWFGLGSKKPGQALAENLSLTINPGQIYSLTGANGSGKTTLLRTIAGLIPPHSGRLTIGDSRPHKLKAQQRTEYVCLAAQQPTHHFLTSSVREELSIGAAKNCPESYREHLLETIGLSQYEDSHPQDLSPVEQHLLALATALAARPSCLLADEPTARVDQLGLTQIIQLLTEYASIGGSVLVATHDHEFLSRLPHRELNMERPDMWPQ